MKGCDSPGFSKSAELGAEGRRGNRVQAQKAEDDTGCLHLMLGLLLAGWVG